MAQVDHLSIFALLGRTQRRVFLPQVSSQSGCTVASGVVFYEHPNYQGRCLVVTADEPDFNWYDFNDVASSVKFLGNDSSGWAAEVFEHTYYMGVSSVLGDYVDFGNNPIGYDRASSVRLYPAQ